MDEFYYLDNDLKQFAYYVMNGELDYSSSMDEIRVVMLISYFRAYSIYYSLRKYSYRNSIINYIAYLDDLNSRSINDN